MCDAEQWCEHGGTCVDRSIDRSVDSGEYKCVCTPLYGGMDCEQRMILGEMCS